MGNMISGLVFKNLAVDKLETKDRSMAEIALSPDFAKYVQGDPPAPAAVEAPAAPPAAPEVPKSALPALFIIEEFSVYTVNGQMGVMLPPVDTIPIFAHEKKTKWVHRTVSETLRRTLQSSALESSSKTASQALSKAVSEASSSGSSQDSSSFDLDSSVHVRGDVGLNVAHGDGHLKVKSNSLGVHEEACNSIDTAVDEQASATQTAVFQSTVSISEDSTRTSSLEEIDEIIIDNSTVSHSINYGLCRLAVEKVTATCLTGVKIGLYRPGEQRTSVYSLPQLDDLLEEAIGDDDNRSKLKQKIIDWLSRPVFDCNDDARKLIEHVDQEGLSFIRFPQHVQTRITLPRSNGEDHVVSVPGIALRAKERVIPTENVGATVVA
jgi:hypothetical protein